MGLGFGIQVSCLTVRRRTRSPGITAVRLYSCELQKPAAVLYSAIQFLNAEVEQEQIRGRAKRSEPPQYVYLTGRGSIAQLPKRVRVKAGLCRPRSVTSAHNFRQLAKWIQQHAALFGQREGLLLVPEASHQPRTGRTAAALSSWTTWQTSRPIHQKRA